MVLIILICVAYFGLSVVLDNALQDDQRLVDSLLAARVVYLLEDALVQVLLLLGENLVDLTPVRHLILLVHW